jgi:gamma-glutamyl:cysteine ligase YbdK (ATP-grasp superfamily)
VTQGTSWGLFDVFGIEMEYMIVDRGSLAVRPIADLLLREAGGGDDWVEDVERGPIAWSNEIVAHLVELKTNGPTDRIAGLDAAFHADVLEANRLLAKHDAMLLGTGAHPLMDPLEDTRIWAHGGGEIYATYDRIFGCKGHGWSNLQSTHLNLPFRGDEEFARLHAAIRLVLPLIPALAASSPFLDGRFTGYLDARLETYRHNQARIPSITGQVIPERLFTEAEYRGLFERIAADIRPHDPDGVLNPLFLNSRGAIARFDRNAIEIRVIDIQECPAADIGVVAAIVALLRRLVAEQTVPWQVQQEWPEDLLAGILLEVARDADQARIADADYLRMLGLRGRAMTAGGAWRALCEASSGEFDAASRVVLGRILDDGPLARRMLRATGTSPDRSALIATCREMAGCLADNRLFPR